MKKKFQPEVLEAVQKVIFKEKIQVHRAAYCHLLETL
jgi:hypothetical protein